MNSKDSNTAPNIDANEIDETVLNRRQRLRSIEEQLSTYAKNDPARHLLEQEKDEAQAEHFLESELSQEGETLEFTWDYIAYLEQKEKITERAYTFFTQEWQAVTGTKPPSHLFYGLGGILAAIREDKVSGLKDPECYQIFANDYAANESWLRRKACPYPVQMVRSVRGSVWSIQRMQKKASGEFIQESTVLIAALSSLGLRSSRDAEQTKTVKVRGATMKIKRNGEVIHEA